MIEKTLSTQMVYIKQQKKIKLKSTLFQKLIYI